MQRKHSFPFEPLTTREKDVLILLADHHTDTEIAAHLSLSRNTVKWYNRQIFQKLGVENRRQALHRARALGLLGTAIPVPLHNLPAQLTPFVGRFTELEAIGNLICGAQPRLLTLVAPGGMGKTRLALAVAEAVLPQFSDGAFFVSLAALVSPAYLVTALADAVGCHAVADDRTPEKKLCAFLRPKRLLLVLDNCEHLLDDLMVVTRLLAAAPNIKVIATSRERLKLTGEMVYLLEGLRYPTNLTEYSDEFGAVRLFLDTAQRANPAFVASEADVVRVCRLVEGMPLALELAGAWGGSLTAVEIGDSIARSADFLQSSARDVPDRLRSIRAVFDAAWSRLGERERQVLAMLSVFRGGCTRDAARAVAGADDATLAELVGRALLRRDLQTARYDIHELLRQYAAEQLVAMGLSDAVSSAHQAYYAAFAERWTEALKDDQLHALDVLELDTDNVRLAFERAITFGTPSALLPFSTMWYFYDIRGRWHEGIAVLDRACAALRGADSLALAKLMAGLADLHERLDHPAPDRGRLAEASVAMLRRMGEERELPLALNQYASALVHSNPILSSALFRESYEIAVTYGDVWASSFGAYALGMMALWNDALAEAQSWLTKAHSLTLRIRNYWGLCHSFMMLARVAKLQGDHAESQRLNEESLSAARRIGHPDVMFDAYLGLFVLAQERSDSYAAKQYADSMVSIERQLGRVEKLYDSLTLLADACVQLNDIEQAKQHLREAIDLYTSGPRLNPLGIFWVASKLFMGNGELESAVRILVFLDNRPELASTVPHCQQQVRQSIKDVLTALSPEHPLMRSVTVAVDNIDTLMTLSARAL